MDAPLRTRHAPPENVSGGFGLSVGLHAAVFGGLIAAGVISAHTHTHWGDKDPVAGAIQASVVSALPLPPKQHTLDKAVLTSDKPSIAPTPPPPAPEAVKSKADPVKPKAEPPPKPGEVLLAKKPDPVKPARLDEREQPTPTKRAPTPPPPPTPKATTGETAGIQIPQSVTQLKNGTASVTVEERAFGDRYAYYIRIISQRINQSKSEGGIDPPDARGKRSVIHFLIGRDGTPSDVEVSTRSGSAALDLSTLRAIERIDSFGPLPQGDHLPVSFIYEAK